MKAILVMEMQESCIECPVWEADFDKCRALNKETDVYEHGEGYDSRPAWCPLKPIPERKELRAICSEYEDGVVDGWNVCLDMLEGSKG